MVGGVHSASYMHAKWYRGFCWYLTSSRWEKARSLAKSATCLFGAQPAYTTWILSPDHVGSWQTAAPLTYCLLWALIFTSFMEKNQRRIWESCHSSARYPISFDCGTNYVYNSYLLVENSSEWSGSGKPRRHAFQEFPFCFCFSWSSLLRSCLRNSVLFLRWISRR